jgi:transcriptional regulator with XRE-family HTH domain
LISKQLQDRIRQRIEQTSMRAVAIELELDVSQLSRWLSGQRAMSEQALNRIGDLLDLEIAEKSKKSAA